MSVQVTQDAELGSVVDLFVKLVEHQRGFVILGVRASACARSKTAMAFAAVPGAGSSLSNPPRPRDGTAATPACWS
jgi:hypothetical protein